MNVSPGGEPREHEKGGTGAFRPLMELVRGLPPHLLDQALTHSSWVEDRVESYERLEFLGDSVLGASIAAHVYDRFPAAHEGDLARWRAFVVSRGSCHVVACRVGLDDLVRTRAPGDQAQREELAGSPTSLGNILEALIGACYLVDGFASVREAVVDAFQDQITFAIREYVDFKSTLQETLAVEGRTVEYELTGEEGPAHERIFRSQVSRDGEVLGRGIGRSIKKSEQRAAREALGRLGVLPPYEHAEDGDALAADEPTCAGAGDGE